VSNEEPDERKQAELDEEQDLELGDEEAGEVGGGLRPPSPPAGPIPIPYPNVPRE
jgi:hypothetical protein